MRPWTTISSIQHWGRGPRLPRPARDAARRHVAGDRGPAPRRQAPASGDPPVGAVGRRRRRGPRPGRRHRPAVLSRRAGRAAAGSGRRGASDSRVNETAYRLATVEHLGQSEAFLTLFRVSVRSGGQERLASATARGLLATNRLLLDSPAARHRKTRALLEDLELVLAEIAQLSPEAPAGDRESSARISSGAACCPAFGRSCPRARPQHEVHCDRTDLDGAGLDRRAGAGERVATRAGRRPGRHPRGPDSAAPAEPRPPAAWLQGDPADSLYRAAREALDRRDYRRAAALFEQVPSRFPRSGYAADAYYWRAFRSTESGGRRSSNRRCRRSIPSATGTRARQPRATPRRWRAASRVSSRARAIPPRPPRWPRPPRPRAGCRRLLPCLRWRRCRPSRPFRRRLPWRPMTTTAAPTTRTTPSSPRSTRCSRWTTPARGPSSGGCWPGGTRPRSASGGRRSSSSRRRAPTATRTSCSRPRGTIPTPRCASRRSSGSRR